MTILWLIERLLVKPAEGSLTDVVINADWRCNGSQESFNGTCYGSCSFQPPSGSFTPYPDLSEEQILGWCYTNGVDKTAIETNVTLQIQNQINPPVVTLPLPWAAQPLPPVPPPVEVVPPLVEQAVPVLVANDASVSDAPAA
jgi:hypothetical protein